MSLNPSKKILAEHQLALRLAIGQVLQIINEYISTKKQIINQPQSRKEARDFKPNIDKIGEIFELSEFEHSLIVLAAAREMEATLPDLCTKVHQNNNITYPTLHLALSTLPKSDWSTYSPSSQVFRWELIRLTEITGINRSFLPLEIDERIMAYLLGINSLDQWLTKYIYPLSPSTIERLFVHTELTDLISDVVKGAFQDGITPKIQLCSKDANISLDLAYFLSQRLKADIYKVPLYLLPTELEEIKRFIFLWKRENHLRKLFLLIDCYKSFGETSTVQKTLSTFLDNLDTPIIIITRERVSFSRFLTFDLPPLTSQQQKIIWFNQLSSKFPIVEPLLEEIISNFQLTPIEIKIAVAKALKTNCQPEELRQKLWDACKIESRPQLDELAKRINAKATWDDLILTKKEKEYLREMVSQVRQRTYVYSQTYFASHSDRGRGINAIFWGDSGTGKTMGAEVIARELDLDLYRVDLSNITSKYIGETEKNLARLFDAADKSGVILLFDEGESLFGKRSEVKDSRDKYANQEVNYLLQRLEEYSGLVIITTNIVDAIDTAFLRRFQFIINFPFPEETQREKIWRNMLPQETVAIREEDYIKLSRLNAAGGTIKNIVLRATFMAAESNRSAITMRHLLKATKSEYGKTGESPTTSEIFGWVADK